METGLRPARSRDEGPEGPEALMISALLDTGSFTPDKYHLTEDHLTCWEKLWRFCVDHQQVAGSAPPLNLVEQKFPEFTYTDNLGSGVGFWAHNLHKAHASRTLRSTLQKAIASINNEEIEEAYALLEGIQRPRVISKEPSDIWTHGDTVEDVEVDKIPVPWDSLGRVTGGIGPAELWYLAGRPGTGKTFSLCTFVCVALKAGYTVRYLSLEMSAAQIHRRVRRQLAGHDAKLLRDLDSTDRETYKKAVDILKERVAGSFAVVDPSHGRATNALVREQQDQAELVVVDHVGLMYTTDGRKAIDDWRAMASISNNLKEDCLAIGTPVLGAVQLNREAEHGTQPPKLNQLSQSDALGQDGDVVVTMRKLSPSVRVWSAEKVREGPTSKWHTRFDPERARFDEVSADLSQELQSLDEDRVAI